MYGIAVHPTQPMLVTSDSQGRIDQWFVLADCQTPPGFDVTASVFASSESRVASSSSLTSSSSQLTSSSSFTSSSSQPTSSSSQPTPKPRIREILTPVAPHVPPDA